jgi:hypothetical protein
VSQFFFLFFLARKKKNLRPTPGTLPLAEACKPCKVCNPKPTSRPQAPGCPPRRGPHPPPARRPHGGLELGLPGRGRGRGSSWGRASVCRRPPTQTRTPAAPWPPRAWGALAGRRGPCGPVARAPPRPLGARCRRGAARSGLLVRVSAGAIGVRGDTRTRGAWVGECSGSCHPARALCPSRGRAGRVRPLECRARAAHASLPLREQPGRRARAGLARARAWGAVVVGCGACGFVARAPPPPCSARAHAAAEGAASLRLKSNEVRVGANLLAEAAEGEVRGRQGGWRRRAAWAGRDGARAPAPRPPGWRRPRRARALSSVRRP